MRIKLRYRNSLLSAILVWVLFCAGSLSAYGQYYVSPQGSDKQSGDSPDHPFKTVDRALRQYKSGDGGISRAGTPFVINLMKGTYILKAPIVLPPFDSSGAALPPLVLRNYGQDTVAIAGGVKIAGWKKYRDGIWETSLPKVSEGHWNFSQLFVNGHRRNRARFPNKGFYRVAGFPDGDTSKPYNTPGRRFEFAAGEFSSKWRNLQDVEVVVYHFWTDSHLFVQSVDDKSHIVTFQNKAGKVFTDDFTKNGARYVINNVFEGLDEPGEWYLDKTAGILYYWPYPNENMSQAEVWAPVLSELLRFDGRPDKGEFVKNVTIKGILFEYVNADLPYGNSNNGQGAASVPAAINLLGARNCSFDHCIVKNIGGYAFNVGDGCDHDDFTHNVIGHTGAGGFIMNGGTEKDNPLRRTGNNIISDNIIRHYGEIYASSVGVMLMNSFDNLVAHNEICFGFYSGISVGREWGYQRSISWGNKIVFNRIYNIGQGLLSDMGAIYTLGVSPGTVIVNNLIHDVSSHSYGGWGIYNDEGSTHIVIENNIVYNTKYAPYNINYTKELTVRNNIFALGSLQQLDRGRTEPHRSLYFENNIIYWKQGVLFEGDWEDKPYLFHFGPGKKGEREETSTFDADWNLYFNPLKPLDSITFHGHSFADWKEMGKDVHSVYADPLFEDPEKFDFRLKPGSPALQLGFREIDMSQVGPRK